MIALFNGRYVVDALGNVYSLINNAGNPRKSPLLMKQRLGRGGYLCANFYVPTPVGIQKQCHAVHRLVATAFHPNPDNKPEVNHKNGAKTDNLATNLEWVTASENALHAFDAGLRTANLGGTGRFNRLHGKSRPVIQLSLDGIKIKEFPSMQEAQREGFSQGNISLVIAGTRKTHKGFCWAAG